MKVYVLSWTAGDYSGWNKEVVGVFAVQGPAQAEADRQHAEQYPDSPELSWSRIDARPEIRENGRYGPPIERNYWEGEPTGSRYDKYWTVEEWEVQE